MDNFEEVVRILASDMGCGLRLQRGLPGMMYVEFGYVEGPTAEVTGPYPTRESCLMTVLHELGHFAHDHTQARPPFEVQSRYFDLGVLHSEAQAWSWALGVAEEEFGLVKFNEDTRRFMWSTCLGSYYRGAVASNGRSGQRLSNGDRGYHSFTYDEADDYFWGVADRLYPGASKEVASGS